MELKFLFRRLVQQHPYPVQRDLLRRVVSDILQEEEPLRFIMEMITLGPDLAEIPGASDAELLSFYYTYQDAVEDVFYRAQVGQCVIYPDGLHTVKKRRAWLAKFAYFFLLWELAEKLSDLGIALPDL